VGWGIWWDDELCGEKGAMLAAFTRWLHGAAYGGGAGSLRRRTTRQVVRRGSLESSSFSSPPSSSSVRLGGGSGDGGSSTARTRATGDISQEVNTGKRHHRTSKASKSSAVQSSTCSWSVHRIGGGGGEREVGREVGRDWYHVKKDDSLPLPRRWSSSPPGTQHSGIRHTRSGTGATTAPSCMQPPSLPSPSMPPSSTSTSVVSLSENNHHGHHFDGQDDHGRGHGDVHDDSRRRLQYTYSDCTEDDAHENRRRIAASNRTTRSTHRCIHSPSGTSCPACSKRSASACTSTPRGDESTSWTTNEVGDHRDPSFTSSTNSSPSSSPPTSSSSFFPSSSSSFSSPASRRARQLSVVATRQKVARLRLASSAAVRTILRQWRRLTTRADVGEAFHRWATTTVADRNMWRLRERQVRWGR
jgi:hypothetical protein